MALKTKNTKETLPLAHMLSFAIGIGNQEDVLEPLNYEENHQIYKSQVIIPYSIYGKTHALMGPMPDTYVVLTKIRDFFPSYHRTKPMVSVKEPLNL